MSEPIEETEDYTSELQDELDALQEVLNMFAVELLRITFVRGDVTVPEANGLSAFTLSYQQARVKDKSPVHALSIAFDGKDPIPLKDAQVKYRLAAIPHLGRLADSAILNSTKTLVDLRAARATLAAEVIRLKDEPTR